jgi:hypothetical protein
LFCFNHVDTVFDVGMFGETQCQPGFRQS